MSGIRAIDKIESFIWEDAKVSSYKSVLLRDLGETASKSSTMADWLNDSRIKIAIEPLIYKWMEYYCPHLQTENNKIIYRGQKVKRKNDITFRNELSEFYYHWKNKGDGWRKYKLDLERKCFSDKENKLYKDCYKKIRTALLQGPVLYG